MRFLPLKVKKFKSFVVRSRDVCITLFVRLSFKGILGKKELLCGIYGILSDGYNVDLSAIKMFPHFILRAQDIWMQE